MSDNTCNERVKFDKEVSISTSSLYEVKNQKKKKAFEK